METKLTVIVDNLSNDALAGEWGLCILAEFRGKKILIDTGASTLFAENLQKLGFEISEIDYGILSHAHYDHANGIPYFLEHNAHAKFYLQEACGENCYHKRFLFSKYIGIPRNMLLKYADRIQKVSGVYELMEGAYLVSHKTPGLQKLGKREKMYQRMPHGWKADDFSHEQSLVLETEKGLVIINSCSHGGAANIIREIQDTFPEKPVYGLIGGFHLYNKTEQEIRELAGKIKDTGISFVCTGHCTKERAYGILKEELGDQLHQLRVGLEMRF